MTGFGIMVSRITYHPLLLGWSQLNSDTYTHHILVLCYEIVTCIWNKFIRTEDIITSMCLMATVSDSVTVGTICLPPELDKSCVWP